MKETPSQLLKEFVNSQQFSSTTEVLSAMKELFRDVLQQVMECELDAQLGYKKRQWASENAVESEVKNHLKSRGILDVYLFCVDGLEDEALEYLIHFKDTWGKQYPSCVKSWEDNWEVLSTFYAYPQEIRRIIYTTNIIEGAQPSVSADNEKQAQFHK